MTDSTITLTADQLATLVESAVAKALAAAKQRAPKREASPEETAKAEQKAAKQAAYMKGKQEVALRKAKETGQHYHVCRKGRKLLVWGDETRAAARRRGVNPDETLGVSVWNTYEGGFRLYMATNRG